MSWMDQISNVLQNYAQSSGAPADEGQVDQHYNQVAQAAPASDMAGGIASVFKSNQTPPFGQLVSQLFGNSNNDQRASLLNTLLSSGAGAGILAQLAKTAGINLPTGANPTISPEDAGRISPEAVQEAAAQAEQHDPSIVDRVSDMYAQHPMLFKTLGALAMSMAMSHMAKRR
ncbi:MAG: hypothetical protein ACR2NX_11705 [Chthoniobacterales bacterium]